MDEKEYNLANAPTTHKGPSKKIKAKIHRIQSVAIYAKTQGQIKLKIRKASSMPHLLEHII